MLFFSRKGKSMTDPKTMPGKSKLDTSRSVDIVIKNYAEFIDEDVVKILRSISGNPDLIICEDAFNRVLEEVE